MRCRVGGGHKSVAEKAGQKAAWRASIIRVESSVEERKRHACYAETIQDVVSQSRGVALKPIIFILGLSGVGKTCTAKAISKDYSLLYIDIDRRRGGFARAGFPPEWDEDVARVDFAILAASVRGCLGDQHQGAVLSFPTTYRFRREQLRVASTPRRNASTPICASQIQNGAGRLVVCRTRIKSLSLLTASRIRIETSPCF